MAKNKWLVSSALIASMLVAAGLGLAGCAKNSSVGQTGNAPSVATESGQAAGSSDQQQAQPGVTTSSQSVQQQPGANGQPAGNSQTMQADMKKALSGLVSKGTITQAQADKVIQLFANNKPGQGGQMGQGGQNSLDQLVTSGTLTQDQLKAVQQVLPQPQGPGPAQKNNQ